MNVLEYFGGSKKIDDHERTLHKGSYSVRLLRNVLMRMLERERERM